jgi:anthranilate phosphoribosyltransferase
MQQALQQLIREHRLDPDAVRAAIRQIMLGQADPVETAAFLTALHMKGETAEDVAAGVGVLREHMIALETGGRPVLDTCGTGGDGSGTFNISTATALVAAACGVGVAKHGNRGVSSASGSADALRELGVRVDADAAHVSRSLREVGLGFCFAPCFHPAMKHVAEVRRRLGFRTLFNMMGPLANPARACYQLVGVGRPEWLDLMAGALARLGIGNAFVVHGAGGLDEVSLEGPTQVRHVRGGEVRALVWGPDTFSLPRHGNETLRVSGPADSAVRIRALLKGERGPARDVVLANVAAALAAAEHTIDLRQGVARAAAAIDNGKAADVLDRLIALSNE